MMIARLSDASLARQLAEILMEAGFGKQEISISTRRGHASTRLVPRAGAAPPHERCYLSVQTNTQLDEDLAKAVFHDFSVRGRNVKARLSSGPRLDVFAD